jgi:hypothetical protein
VCSNLTQVTQLNEALPGQYWTWSSGGSCVIHVDLPDLLQRGANVTEDANLLKHAAVHSLLGCMGLGTRTDITTAGTSRSVVPIQSTRTFTLGENCRSSQIQLGGGNLTFSTDCNGMAD